MKSFDTIQELWDYCEYCPICRRNCREVFIAVGPDAVFNLNYFHKNDKLYLQCTFKSKKDIYTIEYNINCLDNSFTVKTPIPSPSVIELTQNEMDKLRKIKEAYFFFFIEGICNKCQGTSTHSLDLELVDKKIPNIALERESFYLSTDKDNFHITFIHDRNVMLASRCYDGPVFSENNKPIELPLVKLDFSNQERVIEKIKTLILFS